MASFHPFVGFVASQMTYCCKAHFKDKFNTVHQKVMGDNVIKKIQLSRKVSSGVFALKDQVDGLAKVQKLFQDKEINIIHIEPRKSSSQSSEYDIYVDFENENTNIDDLIENLKKQASHLTIHEEPKKMFKIGLSFDKNEKDVDGGLPWFPKHVSDLDESSNKVLMYGSDLDADHPGFKDNTYRQRRKFFTELAFSYKHGQKIPRVDYTEEEIRTWGNVFRELNKLYPTHACKEYLENLPLLAKYCGYREDNVPQLEDVSEFLKVRSGFQLRPVAGYLTSRDFLAGLAFRVFHCTQYIRHGSDPFYTPEPDCCHELLGHMPLLADPSFAEFSQEIGLASLGASDEEVNKLATCYFFTIEFGLCKQDGQLRAYGAGLLSSIGELKHALQDKAIIHPFDPERTSQQECLITTFQDCYFYTDSFEEAKEKMRSFARSIKRPFVLRYNPYTSSVEVLNDVKRITTLVDDIRGELNILSDALKKFPK